MMGIVETPPNHRVVVPAQSCRDCIFLIPTDDPLAFKCEKFDVFTYPGLICDDIQEYVDEVMP